MSYIGNLNSHRGLIGKLGEDFACDHLVSIGHSIIERNYRIRYGEIDIVSRKKNIVHFVEVKTTQSSLTTPEEHIDRRKMIKMKNLADLYFNKYVCSQNNLNADHEVGISLDFIGVVLDNNKKVKSINYLEGLEV